KASAGYSIASWPVDLDPQYARLLRKNPPAWKFYTAQPPGYRKLVNHWITSAKQERTRLARLELLMTHSARGERIPRLVRKKP
ncbi:MAG TPA: YdeI/OmpD-associated family protein, partial [Candidatus Krumholzibacteria bacterium]|nr:YdeI/OmpD-associated family protein [Candidatus Krumholzibacteria bacterium]